MNSTERLKLASFLSAEPSGSDYAGVAGKTLGGATLGSIGGTGLSILALLLAVKHGQGLKTLGEAAKVLERQPQITNAVPLAGLIGGGVGGGAFGLNQGLSDMHQRLSPMGRLRGLRDQFTGNY